MTKNFLQPDRPLVSIVITCYNHARFLGEAIESALAQIYPCIEIIVVDDGSTDNTVEVAAHYPGVKYVHQVNQGLSAARNTGLRESHGDVLIFLDADDRLLPIAAEQGVYQLLRLPKCAFVSGRYRYVKEDGTILGEYNLDPAEPDPYTSLLRCNYIQMHATVAYRRTVLEAEGGFDCALRACEDYDLYLRIARKYPVSVHSDLVAEYRQHDHNMSGNPKLMLKTGLAVLNSNWEYASTNDKYRMALRAGIKFLQEYYSMKFLDQIAKQWSEGQVWRILDSTWHGFRYAPYQLASGIFWTVAENVARRVGKFLPLSIHWFLAKRHDEDYVPTKGEVRFGDFRRLTPISRAFGYDRGLPIDRYYIEAFLATYALDIHGHVLEVGDDSYTRRFGGDRVLKKDILHVAEGNPEATMVADLAHADHIPSNLFDCIILTQTLHLVYDVDAALQTLCRILKPGGVLLATFPGISQISADEWANSWYWSFTMLSARRIFEKVFAASNLTIQSYGNVLTAAAFLQGLAADELDQDALDHSDPHYQALITVRAVRAESTRTSKSDYSTLTNKEG